MKFCHHLCRNTRAGYVSAVIAGLCIAWLLVGPAHAAEPEAATTVLDLDFAGAQAGVVADKVAPERLPATVPAYTVYGRLRGHDAIPSDGVQVAGPAMGRSGALDALRLGAEAEGLEGIGYRFQDGRTFTLLMWLWVYDVRKYFYGTMLVTPRGPVHGYGISLGFQKAKWSKEGWMEWRWGKRVGSEGIWHHGFGPNQWHQLAITYDGTVTTLYVDGDVVDQREQHMYFAEGGQELALSQREPSRRQTGTDFKLDQLTIYDRALTAAEVRADYEAGTPVGVQSDDEEAALLAMTLAIPYGRYGYFQVGEAIPIQVDARDDMDAVQVNDQVHPLPLAAPLSVSYPTPGFQAIRLALLRRGQVVKQLTYPVAILPVPVGPSAIGATEMAAQQPEVRGLGLTLDRVVVDWAAIEPKKGYYDWAHLDAVMRKSQELGAETILCFTGLPRWEARAAGSHNLPADMTRYTKLWRILVSRYDHAVAYEVWNATSMKDSLAGDEAKQLRDYLVLLQAAATAIRRERPDATILAGRLNTGDGIAVATYLQEHAASLYDVFSVRAYTLEPKRGSERSTWAAALNAATSKPVWNTANGIRQYARVSLLPPAEPPTEPRAITGRAMAIADEWTGAAWQIQDLARQRAGGIARILLESGPSAYHPAGAGTVGLPGIKGVALAVFNSLTGGPDAAFSRESASAGVTAIRVERPDGGRCVILFSANAGPRVTVADFAVGDDVQIVDMLGRPVVATDGMIGISTYPLYLMKPPTPNTR